MKLGLGLYRALLDRETLRVAQQAGVTNIVAHLPGHFVRGESKIITSGQANLGFGISGADDPMQMEHLKRILRDVGGQVSGRSGITSAWPVSGVGARGRLRGVAHARSAFSYSTRWKTMTVAIYGSLFRLV